MNSLSLRYFFFLLYPFTHPLRFLPSLPPPIQQIPNVHLTHTHTLRHPSTRPQKMSTTIRRNPVGGLVEEAMENYTHIDRPTSPQYASLTPLSGVTRSGASWKRRWKTTPTLTDPLRHHQELEDPKHGYMSSRHQPRTHWLTTHIQWVHNNTPPQAIQHNHRGHRITRPLVEIVPRRSSAPVKEIKTLGSPLVTCTKRVWECIKTTNRPWTSTSRLATK